jgi:hypothetical protein
VRFSDHFACGRPEVSHPIRLQTNVNQLATFPSPVSTKAGDLFATYSFSALLALIWRLDDIDRAPDEAAFPPLALTNNKPPVIVYGVVVTLYLGDLMQF